MSQPHLEGSLPLWFINSSLQAKLKTGASSEPPAIWVQGPKHWCHLLLLSQVTSRELGWNWTNRALNQSLYMGARPGQCPSSWRQWQKRGGSEVNLGAPSPLQRLLPENTDLEQHYPCTPHSSSDAGDMTPPCAAEMAEPGWSSQTLTMSHHHCSYGVDGHLPRMHLSQSHLPTFPGCTWVTPSWLLERNMAIYFFQEK